MDSFKKDEIKNSAKELLCGIIVCVFLFLDIGALIIAIVDESTIGILLIILFGVAMPAMFIKDILATRVDTRGLLGRSADEITVRNLRYINGLPDLRKNTDCDVVFEEKGVKVVRGKVDCFVEYGRMIDIAIETDSTIEKYVGTSLSGALIGGALFGLPGAIAMGVKNKNKKVNTHYFVITYKQDGNIQYAVFGPVADYTIYHKLQDRIADVRDKIK